MRLCFDSRACGCFGTTCWTAVDHVPVAVRRWENIHHSLFPLTLRIERQEAGTQKDPLLLSTLLLTGYPPSPIQPTKKRVALQTVSAVCFFNYPNTKTKLQRCRRRRRPNKPPASSRRIQHKQQKTQGCRSEVRSEIVASDSSRKESASQKQWLSSLASAG
jgi:hypothetical protein